MPLTKQYLRYEQSASFGLVCGRSGNLLLQTQRAGGAQRRALVVAPAAEDLIVWDIRKGDREAVLRGGKREEVCCVCGSRDGTTVAAGSSQGNIRLWNSLSRDPSLVFSGHKSAVTCLQFDHSATRLVSGSKDTTIVVWDVVSGCGLYRLKGHKGPITGCRWLHHGNVLITSSKDTLVKLWDLDTQHCFQTLVNHRNEVWGIEIVAMETRLVTAPSDRELLVFKLVTGEGVRSEGVRSEGVRERVGDKRREREGDIKVPVSCELMGSLKREGRERVSQIKTDPTGRLLGCLSSRLLELYLVRSAEEREKVMKKKRKKMKKKLAVEGGADPLDEDSVKLTVAEEMTSLTSLSSREKIRSFDMQPAPGNKMMIALGLHSNSIEVYTLDIEATPTNHTLLHSISAPGHRGDVRAVCFSSDDSTIASGSSGSIRLWSRSTRHTLHTVQSGHVLSLTFVPGDRHIVAGTKSGEIQLFEVGSGDLIQSVQSHSGAVWGLDVSPDRHGMVTGSADGDVKFWDFELSSDAGRRQLSLCHVRTLKMAEEVLCVCHSPDGRLLAVGLLDSTAKVFFTDSLKFFLSLYGHKLPVLAMDISSDSSLLVSCSSDKNIRIWGLDFGDCHKSLFAHDDSVTSVKFVPETHLVFSAGKDHRVKCWDCDSFDHIMTLEGHCGAVWCLAVSGDGGTVVTGSHDYSLRLWERTEEPLILSEEREKEREALFEAAVAEGGETIVPGEGVGDEVSMAGRKTMESMRSAEQLMEALGVYREEKVKGQEWEEECRVEQRKVPRPKPHPLLVAMGDITAERYVLNVVKKIKSTELEEALLVMPFSDVTLFLPLLSSWLENGWETELTCRCLLFLLRVHHHQIVGSRVLLAVMDSLRHRTRERVEGVRDLYGFNLAGLRSIQNGLETAGTPLFADTSSQLQRIQKKKRLKTSS